MDQIEITSLSSRGQIVIPQGLRDKLNLHEGEKFVVIGEADTIILKKFEVPSFKGFENLLKKTRKFAREKPIKLEDIESTIKRVRSKQWEL